MIEGPVEGDWILMRNTSEEAVRNLIMALLAVNNYSLEKVYNCHQKLSEEGIFDDKQVSKWTKEKAADRLARAGYDRGSFMNALLAERLLSTCRFLEEGGRSAFRRACETRRLDEVSRALKGVRGVGPVVLRNFSILMDWV